jgi:hypothetical protein
MIPKRRIEVGLFQRSTENAQQIAGGATARWGTSVLAENVAWNGALDHLCDPGIGCAATR